MFAGVDRNWLVDTARRRGLSLPVVVISIMLTYTMHYPRARNWHPLKPRRRVRATSPMYWRFTVACHYQRGALGYRGSPRWPPVQYHRSTRESLSWRKAKTAAIFAWVSLAIFHDASNMYSPLFPRHRATSRRWRRENRVSGIRRWVPWNTLSTLDLLNRYHNIIRMCHEKTKRLFPPLPLLFRLWRLN